MVSVAEVVAVWCVMAWMWMWAIVLKVVDPVRLNTMTLMITGYFQAPCAAIAFASGM